jgi:hypothetical protein
VSNTYLPNDMFSDLPPLLPGEERVMSVEEYERRKKEYYQRKRLEKEQEEIAKHQAEQERKRLLPIKNNLPFDDHLAQEICERVSAGELVINICNDSHMPTIRRHNQWLRDNPEFQQLYNQSVTDRLSIFEEEVIQIADDVQRDYKEITRGGKTHRVVDAEVIARAKLRVDVRFKHLKAGKPTKWGESTTLNVKSEDEFDPANFSADELEKQIADIENKSKVIRPIK